MSTPEKEQSWNSCNYSRPGKELSTRIADYYCCTHEEIKKMSDFDLARWIITLNDEEEHIVAILGQKITKRKEAEPDICKTCKFYQQVIRTP